MTRPRFDRFRLAVTVLLALSPGLAAAQLGPQPLGPARFGTNVQDSMGFQWDINPQGGIQYGTNRCFSGAGILQIGGSTFSPQKQQMTPDGKEYVLSGSSSGVEITRRVRIDVKTATVRFVETFFNPQSNPVTLDVRILTSLRSSVGAAMTDTGRLVSSSGSYRIIVPGSTSSVSSSSTPVPVLGEKDCGLLVMRTSTSYPAVLFYLSAPKSKVKPTLQRSGSYQFIFRYPVLVPPKKTVSIAHGLAQRNIRGTPDPKTLAGHFKPFLSRDFTRSLSAAVRRSILNAGGSYYADETPRSPLLQPVMNLADHWDVERGSSDVLVQDEETRMPGSILGSELTVETAFGKTPVPLTDVAVLVGGGGIGRTMRVHLRNGEILVGPVTTDELILESESGLEVELKPKQVNVLFMHTDPADGKPPAEAVALVKTHHGDRLALSAESSSTIRTATAWGPIDVPLGDIDYMYPIREPQPVHRLVFNNKSRLSVILGGEELDFNTLRFGPTKLAPGAIARLAGVKAAAEAEKENTGNDEEEQLKTPHCRLLGNNVMVGSLDAARLDLLTAAGVTPLDTRLLRLMERQDEDEEGANPAFTFELANGTSLVGRFRNGLFPWRGLGRSWQVPAYHVLVFRRPEQTAAAPPAAATPAEPDSAPAEEKPAVEPAPATPNSPTYRPPSAPVPQIQPFSPFEAPPTTNDPFG